MYCYFIGSSTRLYDAVCFRYEFSNKSCRFNIDQFSLFVERVLDGLKI